MTKKRWTLAAVIGLVLAILGAAKAYLDSLPDEPAPPAEVPVEVGPPGQG